MIMEEIIKVSENDFTEFKKQYEKILQFKDEYSVDDFKRMLNFLIHYHYVTVNLKTGTKDYTLSSQICQRRLDILNGLLMHTIGVIKKKKGFVPHKCNLTQDDIKTLSKIYWHHANTDFGSIYDIKVVFLVEYHKINLDILNLSMIETKRALLLCEKYINDMRTDKFNAKKNIDDFNAVVRVMTSLNEHLTDLEEDGLNTYDDIIHKNEYDQLFTKPLPDLKEDYPNIPDHWEIIL
jgi:hypothetical protein